MTPRSVILVATFFCTFTAHGQEETVRLPAVGAVFERSLDIGGRPVPLPPGKFVVTSTTIDDAKMLGGDISKPHRRIARVLLVQPEEQKLRAAVMVNVALKPGSFRFHWLSQPCRKEDTLFREDLSSSLSSDGEKCLLVDHMVANFTPKAPGMWKEARTWLSEQNVQVPVPVMIVAHVTRMEGWQLISASYAFNPEAFGCDTRRYRPWAESPWHRTRVGEDAQKVRFVESVTAWGKVAQVQIEQIVSGKGAGARLASADPIHRCP